MYAFFGEKSVRLFDSEEHMITYKDFYDNYQKTNYFKIILDRINVDFSLDHLKNSNIFDAYGSLQCYQKIMTSSERAFIVPKDNLLLFKKDDFYIQKNIINDLELFQKIRQHNEIFLIEYAIAALCKEILRIDEKTWWLYVAEHRSSGLKIVAGIGNGIAYSRIIPFNLLNNVSFKVIETIKFLTRNGLKNEIKIISFIDNLFIDNLDIVNMTVEEIASKLNLKNKTDMEIVLIKYLSINKKIKAIFLKDNRFRLFIKEHINKIYALLCVCFFSIIFTLYNLQNKITREKEELNTLKKAPNVISCDLSGTVKVEINDKNIVYIQQIIDILKENKNPLNIIKAFAKILNDIKTEAIILEKCNCIKIKCILNKKLLQKLQKLSNIVTEITKTNNSETEYEDINDSIDKNFGAEICIKMK
jgi:hypothetical protein